MADPEISLKDPFLDSQQESSSRTSVTEDATFFELFRIQSVVDVILIFFGFVSAIITGASIPAFNVLMGQLINDINDKDSGFGSSINTLIRALIALAFINLVSGTVQIYCWSCNGERQARRLRDLYVRSILRQEIGWFDTIGAGELATRVSDLCGQVQDGIGRKFGDLEQYFVQVVASFAASFYLSWELTVVLIGAVPFIGMAGWFMIDAVSAAQHATADQYAAAGGVAMEALSSIRTVSALNAQPMFIKRRLIFGADRYRQFLIDAMKIGIRKGRRVGLSNGILFCVCFFTYSLGFWYGARLVARDIDRECTSRCATGGKIISVFFCVIMGSVGVGQMAPPMNAFFSAKAAAGQMVDVIKRRPEIDGLADDGVILEGGDLVGNIELKNVTFAYPSRPDNTVCMKYSLNVKRGEVVALCGISGCGKSTIVNLILRFYDPQEGQILIDGVDTREMNLRWLRSRCGYVGQEPVLFNGTIAENIACGLDMDVLGVGMSEVAVMDRVQEAAELSHAHEFIELFPGKYDTRVGTNGVALSGGQKQRIAIARALVKRPAILLLDEATSALDAASEQLVQQSIDALQQSRAQTTLVIAHRLSTIRNADKIALISSGSVAEFGSHEELVARDGMYAELVRLQMDDSPYSEDKLDQSWLEEPSGLDLRSISSESVACGSLHSAFRSNQSTPVVKSPPELVIASGLRNASRSMSFSEQPDVTRLIPTAPVDQEGLTPDEKKMLNMRVWALIMKNPLWLLVGLTGAAVFGAVFPLWGMILARAENMFFYEDTDKMRRKATVQAIYFAGLGLVSLLSCTLQYWGIAQVGERLSARMRSDLFEAYMRRGIPFFDEEENSAGELCTRLSDDSRIVHKAGGEALAKQLQAVFTLLVGCVIGFSASWRIALVVIACFPANIIASAIQMQALSGQQYDMVSGDDGQNGLLGTVFTNMRTINAFSMQFMMSEKYTQMVNKVSQLRMNRAFLAGLGFGASNMSLFLTYTLLFWYGQRLMNRDQVTFQNMMISIFSLMLGALGLGQAMIDMTDQNEGLVAARRIFRAVDAAAADHLDGLATEGTAPPEGSCQGRIDIKNLTFSYPTRLGIGVCNSLNVTISAGEVVAIVGPSGSGKSTILNLLLRFYDPTQGEVTVDGHNIVDLDIRWLRAQVGYVGQEPVLFSGSIADNIKMGCNGSDKAAFPSFEEVLAVCSSNGPSTFASDESGETAYLPPEMFLSADKTDLEESGGRGVAALAGVDDLVYNACVTSNAHEFISTFPLKYDTNVGEKSVMISGGQKQRIAIARALVKRPAILLLDEATSALDAASEQLVQQSIDALQQSRAQTTLVIAHRLSTIRNADRIIVMDGGVIVEEGTHEDLMSSAGLYMTLWNKQQGGGRSAAH